MALQHKQYADSNELAKATADWVCAELKAAIEARGSARLVVSGGSTPAAMFAHLAQEELAWDRVVIYLADDRWVSHDHSDSNAKLVREKLQVGNAAIAVFRPFPATGSFVEADAVRANQQLLSDDETFDVVLLGMGDDGHTASLFPCSEQLTQGLDMESGLAAIAVHPTTAPYGRISMTLPRLLNTRQLALLVKGESKQKVLDLALAEKDATVFPIRAFLHQTDVPMTTFWSP